ncbi:MAG: matrixin family metalloprotease [Kofleriaceae bacterium]|nr:matrixin family metalloprotease [Kofleriaceae bacterium]
MTRTRALLMLVGIGGCMTPVMHFGEGKTAKQAQHDTMTEMGPARLVTGEKWNGEVTTRKVRVWADEQYRTQNRQWQKAFDEPLELANLVVTPIFGIHIVAEYATWDRNVPDATLRDHMAALQEQDRGDDVLAVIGLTSSLSLVSATFDELGLAMVGGRHIVLRGYADLEERKMYANAFPDLRAEEREMALVQLRRHKTAVVLLHELGHVLGVEHEIDSSSIMNATYSNHATTFSTTARATMLATLDQRLHRKSPTAVMASAPAQPQPEAAPAAPKVHHAPIVIRVTRKRMTIVDGKSMKPDELDALLKAAYVEDPETKIVVNEDRNVPTGVVGELLDRAKAFGFVKVEFGWSGK